MGHDLITIYWLKGLEYILAVSYLPLFVLFWKFVTPTRAAEATVTVAAPSWADDLAGYFQLPAQLFFHQGHAWARVDGPDTVTVGMNDFAQHLVGRIDRLHLPAVGTELVQGMPALGLESARKSVEMLSPVSGTVVELNAAAARDAATVKQAPYGEGWLFRVKSPQLAANLTSLMTGTFARRWMDAVTDQLAGEFSREELGHVYADGGTPVDGLARSLAHDEWDAMARRYFLTDGHGGSNA
ncbi:MAG: glycine cleavage system protein H [Acidobacteria bacterium]|nr:MAG: glycine cleavage system protein H [Acidobacteriota bacterium]RPJ73001.1 MAG: glycine cleavage system protein H [Acidobacteriota bacterium]